MVRVGGRQAGPEHPAFILKIEVAHLNRLLTVAWVILLLMSHSARAEKTLAWNALKVQAHLDGEGRLHIVERHDMLFTDAWNGGERTFRIDRSQELVVESVTRIDAAGKPHLLATLPAC